MKQKIYLALNSFRWRLTLLFGALSLVTLLIATSCIGKIAMNELAALSGETLYASAKSAADLLSLGLHEKEKNIHLLSAVPSLKKNNLSDAEIRTLLELRKETYSAFAWLGVVDMKGIILQGTGGMLVGDDVSQRRWFKTAAAAPSSSDFHAVMLLDAPSSNKILGKPESLIDFSVPIIDENNQVRGVLSSRLLWDWVTRTISSAMPADAKQRGIEILIADQSGAILYPSLTGNAFQSSSDWKNDEHYRMVDWEDGHDYLVSQAPVKMWMEGQSEWRIIARQPIDQAYAPAYGLVLRLAALGGGAAILFTIAVYYASSHISRPIEQLAQTVRDIARHETPLEFPSSKKIIEIQQLSDSIQATTTSLLDKESELEALNASLEKQVEDRTKDLVRLNQELEKLATTDGLTGVNNRRSFDEKLHENFLFMRRQKTDFSLLVIDIDHFKKVNDVHGHQTGDCVLRQLAQILKDNIRITDFVARYGGEEFVVLLPNIKSRREGFLTAEKIRRAVSSALFALAGRITISIGVSHSHQDDETEHAVLERADKALYMAKESGRNRSVSLPRQTNARQAGRALA